MKIYFEDISTLPYRLIIFSISTSEEQELQKNLNLNALAYVRIWNFTSGVCISWNLFKLYNINALALENTQIKALRSFITSVVAEL